MSDHEDNEEEFSHTFRRYVRTLERMTLVQERQTALAEREMRKSHGLQMEMDRDELRARLGQRAKAIQAFVTAAEKLPEPPEDDRPPFMRANSSFNYGPVTMGGKPVEQRGPFRPDEQTLRMLRQRAKDLIEWAAHLTDDKRIYVLSTHEWQGLFDEPDLPEVG